MCCWLACEPGTFGPEEGQMGLSEPVEAVVDEAVKLVESLIVKILNGDESTAKNVKRHSMRGDCRGHGIL